MDTALPFQLDNEHSFGALKKSGPFKITIVSETLPPDVNGVAMTMGKIIEGLWIAKHEITLVHPQSTQDNSNTTTLNRMTVRGVPIPFYSAMQFGMPALGRLHMQWTQQRPHLVHIVTEGPLGWSALQAAKKLGIPVVSGFHTNFHSYSKHYGFGVLEPAIMRYLRWFHNKANVTLVPTQELANALTIKGINNTVVLSRGVDTNQFSPAHRSQSLRACWGVSENDLIVIYVGRLAAEKNLDLTMDAFCEIKNNNLMPKWCWLAMAP